MRRVGPEVPPTGTDGWPCLLGSIGRTARERPDGMSRGRLRVTFFFWGGRGLEQAGFPGVRHTYAYTDMCLFQRWVWEGWGLACICRVAYLQTLDSDQLGQDKERL